MQFEILTPSGFQSFKGIGRYWHERVLHVEFHDETKVVCAFKHIFIKSGEEVFAENLLPGDDVGKKIKSISIVEEPQYLYDPLNVENGSIYTHDDGLTSHNSFLGTSQCLIAPEVLLQLRAKKLEEFLANYPDVRIYESVQKDHKYVMTVDVSKGRGRDYSTFTIVDITDPKGFHQVATYRSNTISPLQLPDIAVKFAKKYNMAIMLIESNDVGQMVARAVYYELEYENIFMESSIRADGLGVTMTARVKRIGCSNLKDLIEMGKLQVVDPETLSEISTFQSNGSSYEATDGNHDDLVMNLVLFAWFVSTEAFGSEISSGSFSLQEMLFGERAKHDEEMMTPFGFNDNGVDNQDSRPRGYDEMIAATKEMFG